MAPPIDTRILAIEDLKKMHTITGMQNINPNCKIIYKKPIMYASGGQGALLSNLSLEPRA
jgi:hypothetical protein